MFDVIVGFKQKRVSFITSSDEFLLLYEDLSRYLNKSLLALE
jgi:hypothetical protein